MLAALQPSQGEPLTLGDGPGRPDLLLRLPAADRLARLVLTPGAAQAPVRPGSNCHAHQDEIDASGKL